MGEKSSKIKAIALLSGGLDSVLSIHVMMEQGIDVIPLHFYTWFTGSKSKEFVEKATKDWLLPEPIIIDVKDEFLEVLLNPKYGYGCNMNPCIDCKILFFQKGKGANGKTGS
ncbi:MAG: hypothetical protein ACPLSJ_05505 [Thermosulfidibacteraceae bacterium]|jgi:tRNA U34 2-thiouridine synthase MnmA/TrmU